MNTNMVTNKQREQYVATISNTRMHSLDRIEAALALAEDSLAQHPRVALSFIRKAKSIAAQS